ncbi:DUF2478 domain-containing protein [Bradyrhizobium sp. SEMIA]|uniref:DUF2478 domain-containing protein n=1 Tax=Bradyrhizobium sp. SEMIA TaxID=2597515 RepID=UPI0018A5355F|nr:DUF2478 domain-containing protein [Bradyrhizobium sp. SEMIA]
MSCNLDTNGLAEAAAVVSQALRNKIDLLVMNKFAKQEATAGAGLRAEFVGPTSTDSRCRKMPSRLSNLHPGRWYATACDRQSLEQ